MKPNWPIAVTFLSNALPLVLVLAVIPLLARSLDGTAFGFFMAGWSSLGFTSLLDLGLGRGIAHYAARASTGDEASNGPLCQAAFVLLVLVGSAVSVVLIGLLTVSSVFLDHWFAYAPAVAILILCVPPAVVVAGLRGALEGSARFNAAAAARVASACILVVVPAAAALHDSTLVSIAIGFLLARLLATFVYLIVERRYCGLLSWPRRGYLSRKHYRSVLSYSGWIGASNLLGTILAYLDRLFLSLSSLGQMAIYAPPFELASRVLLIPGAVVTVLFTAFSEAGRSIASCRRIVARGYITCLTYILPPLAVFVVWPEEILGLWLGSAFQDPQQTIARYICAGVVLNGLAHIPVAAIQGMGFPRVVTTVHLIEIGPSVALFAWLIGRSGAEGAAQAWAIRSGLDLLLMQIALSRGLRARERSALDEKAL